MANKVTREFNGKKYQYFLNGELYGTSIREFKYACVATTSIAKGANSDGYSFVIALGNKKDSTYNSKARYYKHCNLEVAEIEG